MGTPVARISASPASSAAWVRTMPARTGTGTDVRYASQACGWSWNAAPTGASRATRTPWRRRSAAGPTPDSRSRWAVAMAPAHSTISRPRSTVGSPSTTADTPVARPSSTITRWTTAWPVIVRLGISAAAACPVTVWSGTPPDRPDRYASAVLTRTPWRTFAGTGPAPGGPPPLRSGSSGCPSSRHAARNAAGAGPSRSPAGRPTGTGPPPPCTVPPADADAVAGGG